MWDKDIEDYCRSRKKERHIVIGILTRKGWNSQNYQPSMKTNLFDWLDQWYTLSIKNLPEPATKRNPSTQVYRRMTHLPGGWRIVTSYTNGEYLTQVRNNGPQFVKIDRSKTEADITHTELVERILRGD
jgi:hypothetical protein